MLTIPVLSAPRKVPLGSLQTANETVKGDGKTGAWKESRRGRKKRRREGKIKEKGREEGTNFLIQTLPGRTDNKSLSPKSLHIPQEGHHPYCSDLMGRGVDK